jgi:hypothetical protein
MLTYTSTLNVLIKVLLGVSSIILQLKDLGGRTQSSIKPQKGPKT